MTIKKKRKREFVYRSGLVQSNYIIRRKADVPTLRVLYAVKGNVTVQLNIIFNGITFHVNVKKCLLIGGCMELLSKSYVNV